jgi:hypothetical protein
MIIIIIIIFISHTLSPSLPHAIDGMCACVYVGEREGGEGKWYVSTMYGMNDPFAIFRSVILIIG